MGGLAPEGGMNRGAVLGNSAHADQRRARRMCGGGGGGTTVSGVASSRASAAPSLRYGPSGDPTPATVGATYMAESTLSARNCPKRETA